MAKIQCKLGGFSPVVLGRTYNFTRDRDNPQLYTAEVDDDKHVEMLLAVEHYVRLDVPKPAIVAPPPPAPAGLTEAELVALLQQAGTVDIEKRTVDGLDITVVLAPFPEIVGVPTSMLDGSASWYTINGELLYVDVFNGRSRYLRQGMLPDGAVYKLDGAAAYEAPPAADAVVLVGSDTLPGSFEIGAEIVQLGDIVASAAKEGNFTDVAWNELEAPQRDVLILAEVDRRKAAAQTPRPPAPTATAPTTDKPQLDHDDDGKAGGSKPRSTRKRPPRSKPAAE